MIRMDKSAGRKRVNASDRKEEHAKQMPFLTLGNDTIQLCIWVIFDCTNMRTNNMNYCAVYRYFYKYTKVNEDTDHVSRL